MAQARKAVVSEPLYLVQWVYEEGWDSIFCNSAAVGGGRPEWGAPVKAFTARAPAEALCGELRMKLLDGSNPFRLSDREGAELADVTSLPPGPFRDWLLDAGLKPPAAGSDRLEDWALWWDKNRRGMSAEQRHRALAGLDKLRFYAVAELPPTRASEGGPGDVFTVDLLKWKDDDDFLLSLTERGHNWTAALQPCFTRRGGIRLATFRDRARADAYRDELQRQVPRGSRSFFRDGFGVSEHRIEVDD